MYEKEIAKRLPQAQIKWNDKVVIMPKTSHGEIKGRPGYEIEKIGANFKRVKTSILHVLMEPFIRFSTPAQLHAVLLAFFMPHLSHSLQLVANICSTGWFPSDQVAVNQSSMLRSVAPDRYDHMCDSIVKFIEKAYQVCERDQEEEIKIAEILDPTQVSAESRSAAEEAMFLASRVPGMLAFHKRVKEIRWYMPFGARHEDYGTIWFP